MTTFQGTFNLAIQDGGIDFRMQGSSSDVFDFYVDKSGGSDSDDGLTPETAWETLVKVDAQTFSAGDRVGFKRGELWRESLSPSDGGSSGNHIFYGAYGSGPRPLVKGSKIISTWVEQATSIAFPGVNLDDVYIRVTNADFFDNDNLFLGNLGAQSRESGIRFINNIIPKDATITSAFVRLTPRTTLSGTTVNITISGEDTDEPAIFSTFADFDGRGDTTATVAWNAVPAWTDGTQEDTPDIATILDEVTSFTNWASGDDVVTFFRDNASTAEAHRIAQPFNVTSGSEKAELHVVYSTTNVWESAVATEPKQVWFDGVRGTPVASVALVNSANKWYYDTGTNLLYVFSTSDPDTAFTNPGIEAGDLLNIIKVINKAFITFDSLNIMHSNGTAGFGAGAFEFGNSGSCNNILINNCDISENNWCAIYSEASDANPVVGLTITNNIFTNNTWNESAGATIMFDWVDDSYVGFNTFVGSREHDQRLRNSDDNIWEFNHSTNPGSSSCALSDTADPGNNPPIGNIIRYNFVQGASFIDPLKSGYDMGHSGGGNQIYYNVVVDSNNAGMRIQNAVAGDVWYNNTIIGSADDGIQISVNATGCVIKNNIVKDSGARHIDVSSGAITGHDIDNNLYFPDGANLFRWNSVMSDDFADWKVDSSQDANSPTPADPLFEDEATDDYRLKTGSPAIDAGEDVSLIRDFAGITVPQGALPDIGAHEKV